MRAPLALSLLVWPAMAYAQPQSQSSTSTTADALREQIRQELEADLRQRLKEEIKAEIKRELAEEGAMTGAVQEDSWAEEEWKWEEPVKPELNFLELDGYFRFRYDFFHNLDLDLYDVGTNTGPFSVGSPPVPICNSDPECAAQREPGGESLGGANIRLRLEPIFNVYEDIKIKMQVDVLDNLVLGSTPEGFPKSDRTPLVGFSQTQLPPSDGVNALMDSVRFKRVWAEVMTPLGQLRFGRQPSHWGMGLLANGGQGVDSDFGDTADRILFATKIAGHYIIPGYDWAASGPSSAFRGIAQDQPFDRAQNDDVDQYILAIARRDKDEEIKEKLENDELVINYGVYGVYRNQALDAAVYYANDNPNLSSSTSELVARDMELFVYSAWFKLQWRKLLLELEQVGIFGDVENTAVSGNLASMSPGIVVQQWAGSLRFEYKLLQDALTLHFLTVLASGDDAPGWGITPLLSTQAPGVWDGNQSLLTDTADGKGKISNFRVDPDFQVDLIFWRQLVGMVTDALVIRPGVQYNLTEGLGGRLDLVYSRAWFAESTPSGGTANPSHDIGLEADAKIFYASEDGFSAWLQYGIFFPFGALNRQVQRDGVNTALDASIAQTIQLLLAVTY